MFVYLRGRAEDEDARSDRPFRVGIIRAVFQDVRDASLTEFPKTSDVAGG